MDSVIDKINKIKSTVSGALPGNPVSREYELDKQDVTVWILEKKQFDVANKGQKEFILDSMRRGISNLTRLRHPKILSVVHPLEESRESFAFATEPLLASLANLIGATSNLSDAIICSISNYEFSEVEIKYGMLQLCEALGFLHNDCHQAHLNLTPASIVLNRVGTWKLCGFEFSEQLSSSDESSSARIPIWTQDGPLLTQPSLNFCAPELAIRPI
ncbi:unnamed protein product [Protopolystoma xenopodis]|uniref:Protein kinase domain-containing protein n=1 Tax=Protopolystoma xenopodis TaxID=117903 RepID=A0A3S5BBF9_9PLAT|nr:unnamed protein product [Protopolystoma xenopodis]